MSEEKSFHMTPEEFRRHGHAVVDWIADYYTRVESFPVLAQVEPGSVRASLPQEPPAHGERFDAILGDVEKLILPGVTHWQSPNFFAFFPANSSGPAILGDLLSSGLGVQGMLWARPARNLRLMSSTGSFTCLACLPNFYQVKRAAALSRTQLPAQLFVRFWRRASAPLNTPATNEVVMAVWWLTLLRRLTHRLPKP
jgi:hypothetical protein